MGFWGSKWGFLLQNGRKMTQNDLQMEVHWRGVKNPPKMAILTISRGSPGKMTKMEKRRGKSRGVFRVFSGKNGVFGDFWRGGVSVIKRGTSIALR